MSASAAAVIEINDSSDEDEDNNRRRGGDVGTSKSGARLAMAKLPSQKPDEMDSASWKLIQQLLPTVSNNDDDDDDEEVQVVPPPPDRGSGKKTKRSRVGAPVVAAAGATCSTNGGTMELVAKLQAKEESQQRRQKKRRQEEEKLGLSFAKSLQKQFRDEDDRHVKIHRPTPKQVFDELKTCQKKAISFVREKAKTMHEKALPQLKKRVSKLGLTELDLTKCLDYIRDDAPIVIHVSQANLSLLAKDTHYRSLFETNTSGGSRSTAGREQWEKAMFGDGYDGAAPFDRPKYGCLNVTGDITGVNCAKGYGDCFLLLHQHVRHRATFFNKDTGGFVASAALATCEYYAHILNGYSDIELSAAINVASTSRIRGAPSTCAVYKEVQIHGPVCLATDIQALSVPGMQKGASKQLLEDVKKLGEKANGNLNVFWQGDLLNDAS